jgi:Protein of unknown function (DUF1549)/Protein of unknown function (DUF1553)
MVKRLYRGFVVIRCWFLPAALLALLTSWEAPLGRGIADDKDHSVKRSEPKREVPLLGKTGDAEIVHFINDQIAAGWKANKLKPSERASDYEFMRRAYLDIIGRIAKPEEIQRFLRDPEAVRRPLLIDRLLQTPEYARNWASIWTVWLMTRTGANEPARAVYHEQMHKWLEDLFAREGASYKDMVTELITASGKTNENGAVNYILSHLGEQNPPNEQGKEGRSDMVPITSRTIRLFDGLQIQCAQCHPHPFNKEWKQDDFWGVNAFFRQVDTPRGRPGTGRMAMETVLEVRDNPDLNTNGKIFYEERNGVLRAIRPQFLHDPENKDNDESLVSTGGNRRQDLARFVTGHRNFARAYVNRIWAHFFGRGFTNPIDDFGPDNEPSHPELLDKLGQEFAHYGYDPRRLMRWICNSEAYNLSSVANKTNDTADAEPFFSRMLLKALSPEQLFESLMTATQAEMFESRESRRKIRDGWMRNLSTNFGDDEGNEVTFNGTVVQALLMMNGSDINSAIASDKKGTVAWAVVKKQSPSLILDYLYEAALNRPPTMREKERILAIRHAPVSRMGAAPLAFWQDVFWALLNSNEFILNH